MRKLATLVLAALAATATVFTALPAGAAKPTGIRIVNLNLLHGVFCGETNFCQGPDRVKLLAQQLEAAKCPEVVGLQEINQDHAKTLDKIRKTLCGGKYKVVFKTPPKGIDTERMLTTLPVKSTKVIKLSGNFRTASRAVLDTPIGPLVIVVTHQDGDPEVPFTGTCRTCRPPCSSTDSPYDCQTKAAAGLADEVGGSKAIRVLMGDFNVTPASKRYQTLVGRGWVDAYQAAGNPECDPATGIGCTSGRDDMSVEALKDPNAKEAERIDFIFVKAPATCTPVFDPVGDSDGDGLGTGLFGNTPATNGPGGMVWTSDHTAVSADLSCT